MGKNASVAPTGSKPVIRPRSSSPRYVFGALFAIYALNYLDRFVLTGSANTIAKELGFSLDGVGFISSAFLIVYTLSTIPLGMWADRASRKNVVALCVAIWSLATALTALATNFMTLFIGRMVLGIGEAGYFPAGTALLSDYFSRDKRSRTMTLWSMAQFIGILGGFVLGGVMAGLFVGGWRLAFLLTGIPGLFLAFLAWRIQEPRRNQAEEEATELEALVTSPIPETTLPHDSPLSKQSIFVQCAILLRIKTLLVITFIQIFAYFVLSVCSTFLPIYLQQKDTFKLQPGQAGLYSGVVIVLAGLSGTVAGGYVAALLERRYAGARVFVCGLAFTLGAPSLFVALTAHNLISFTIFFFLTGALLAAYNGPITAALQDIVPFWLRSTAVAFSMLIAHLLGDAVSPSLVGVLATAFDPGHGLHFQEGLAGHDLALALLITAVPALLMAGLAGLFGARWMHGDVIVAEQAELRHNSEIA